MAKVFDNVLISGLKGKLGNQLVFRVVKGATIVSRAAGKPDRKKETAAQRKTRSTFKAASLWARATLLRPEQKKHYTELAKSWNLSNAYTAAIKHYMLNSRKVMSECDFSETSEPACESKIIKRDTNYPSKHTAITHKQLLLINSADRKADNSQLNFVRIRTADPARTAFKKYLHRYGILLSEQQEHTKCRESYSRNKNDPPDDRFPALLYAELP